MKDFKFLIFAIFIIMVFLFHFLPNLVFSDNNHLYEFGTLRKVYTETYEISRRGRRITKKRLVLVTEDQTQRKYKLTGDFKKYWPHFQDSTAIGKYLNIKLDIQGSRKDPMEIIMGDKHIYGKFAWIKGNWIFIALFLWVIGYGFYSYKKNPVN